MNETLFFFHALFILITTLVMLRFGKKGLSFFFILQVILANLLVLKEISLFGLSVTASDVYTIGATLSLCLLQEHYGEKVTNRTILLCFICLVFFVVMQKFHLLYQKSPSDTMHETYQSLFSSSPRIFISSILVSLSAQKLNSLLYSFFKRRKLPILIRSQLSMSISQMFDTFAFSFLALYGIVHNLFHIIIFSLIIKMLAALLISPTVLLSKRFHRVQV